MINSKFDLTKKLSLITGAAGLLGFEHACALLECNSNIIITDIDFKRLCNLKQILNDQFPASVIDVYEMDVTSFDSIKSVQNDLLAKNLSLDILINNAAIDPKVKESNSLENSRIENFSREDWDLQLSVGLTGAFQCCQIFGSFMASQSKGGVILNIASDLSVIAPDQRIYKKKNLSDNFQPVKPITYSVIKSGLIGLTKYISTYWSDKNVRCNALSPGGVFNDQPEEFVEKISELIPLGRMANKDEYRAAIQFLCSEASSYMNGHNLVMDGGRSVW